MAQPAEYPIRSSHIEAARLNLQHYNWKQTMGFLIHPRAMPKVPNPKIADIGTGTAIWLCDLSDSISLDAQLHGYDIDLSRAPPREWLPLNVSLHELNMFEDIPENLVGQYDVVHVRFMLLVVQNGDPRPLLDKFRRLLKPGGFLQWTEMDFTTFHIETVDPIDTLPASKELLKIIREPTPRWSASAQNWTTDLASRAKAAGYTNVHEERQYRKPWQNPSYHDVALIAYSEMSLYIPDMNGSPQLLQAAAQEFADNRRGAALKGDCVTVIAENPQTS